MKQIFVWVKKNTAYLLLLLTAIVGSWMLDHDRILKETDISPSGILTYEFADTDLIAKINTAWENDFVFERTTMFYKMLYPKSVNSPKKKDKVSIARNSIIADFIFILLYTSTLYLFSKKLLAKWNIHHYDTIFKNQYFRRRLIGRKVKILFWICVSIGFFDTLENIIMLFNLCWKGLYYPIVWFKILFVKIKFYLLIYLLVSILFTFIYQKFLILLINPAIYKNKFIKLF